jgi:seryl-tRNA synthetase
MKTKQNADTQIALVKAKGEQAGKMAPLVRQAEANMRAHLSKIANSVQASVPVSNDEKDNVERRSWGAYILRLFVFYCARCPVVL